MPAFVTLQSGRCKVGETLDATLCDPHAATGQPNHKTDVPVRVRLVNEHVLSVDGEPREIVSCVGGNGRTTYLVNASSRAIRNAERRRALAKATTLLHQLRDRLLLLKDESDDPEFVVEGFGLLCEWVNRERERITAAPRSEKVGDNQSTFRRRRCSMKN